MQLISPGVQDMLGTLPPGERDELLALVARAAAGDSMRAEGPAP